MFTNYIISFNVINIYIFIILLNITIISIYFINYDSLLYKSSQICKRRTP